MFHNLKCLYYEVCMKVRNVSASYGQEAKQRTVYSGHFSNEGVCLIFDCARATFSLFLISSLTLRRIESCLGAFFDSFETFFQTRNRSRYHC